MQRNRIKCLRSIVGSDSHNSITPLRWCLNFGGEITFSAPFNWELNLAMCWGEKMCAKKQWYPYHWKFCCFSKIQRFISFLFAPSPPSCCNIMQKCARTVSFSVTMLMWWECCFKFLVQDFTFLWYHINAWFLSKFVLWAKLGVSWFCWCCKLCTVSCDFCLPAHFSAFKHYHCHQSWLHLDMEWVILSLHCEFYSSETHSRYSIFRLFLHNYFNFFS